jgi:hypothetical protein
MSTIDLARDGLVRGLLVVALSGVVACVGGQKDRVSEVPTPNESSPVLPTQVRMVRPPLATPGPDPNWIPYDAEALREVNESSAALEAAGRRCRQGYIFHYSHLLSGSFCYPPSWQLVRGDPPAPPGQRPEPRIEFSLLIRKLDSRGREVARVSIAISDPALGGGVKCPDPGALQLGNLPGTVCFMERRDALFYRGIARIVHIGLPRTPGLPDVSGGFQVVDTTPDAPVVVFSRADQREALEIIASIRFDP